MKRLSTLVAAALLAAACTAPQAQLTKSGLDPKDFESTYNGKPTALYTLTNEAGMEVCITNFGGRIVSIMVPDRNGEFRDVVLGFDKVSDYFPENNKTDFGACIGRYANRIDHGRITIDGENYQLSQNNTVHCLHGGETGWQYQVYEAAEVTPTSLKLVISSPDGDNGFPGNVVASCTYTLTEDNKIDMVYEAATDKATVVNMTNHSYFNLSGDPANHSICDDLLQVNASTFTPSDSTFMTTGEIVPLEEHPAFDFRTAKTIGQDINADDIQLRNGKGYDHNWVLDTGRDITVPALTITCPETGICLTEYTDEPGVQIYTGNFLDGTVTGKKGVAYAFRTAVCVESQKYPDSPNKPQWPSALLRPGETYHSHTVFAFGIADAVAE